MECRIADRNSAVYYCEHCGKPVQLPNYKVQKLLSGEQKHFYCSKECRLKNERPTIDKVRKQFADRGYILISQKYHTAKTKLDYICKKHKEHGIQSINYDNFKTGCGCRYCGDELTGIKKRVDFNTVQKAFSSKGFILLEQEYIGSHIPLKYICKKHPEAGIQKMSYTNVLYCCGCPHCKSSKGEISIQNYLREHNIEFEYQKKYDDLLGVGNRQLSYDFFIPKFNKLIEYQGEYHDGTARNQSEEQFKIQQEHDHRKREYAKRHDIKLEEIWYYEDLQSRLETIFN